MPKKIKTLIIDDEKNSRENTKTILGKYFPEIEVIGEASDGFEGRKLISEQHPELVFLDVNMPEMSGFEMLDAIPNKDFYVIFLTAYNDYTLQALRAGAVDYLVKPLMKSELTQAINKVVKHIEENNKTKTTSVGNDEKNKLLISHSKGFNVIEFNEIIWLEASGNYTNFYLTENRKIISSRTLKDYEMVLDDKIFFRISRSALVNLNHIKEYNNADEILILTEKQTIHVSKVKWAEFSDLIRQKTINLNK